MSHAAAVSPTSEARINTFLAREELHEVPGSFE